MLVVAQYTTLFSISNHPTDGYLQRNAKNLIKKELQSPFYTDLRLQTVQLLPEIVLFLPATVLLLPPTVLLSPTTVLFIPVIALLAPAIGLLAPPIGLLVPLIGLLAPPIALLVPVILLFSVFKLPVFPKTMLLLLNTTLFSGKFVLSKRVYLQDIVF